MPDKIASINKITREQFFDLFAKYLNETEGIVVLEERKPESIRFNVIPPVLKEGIIELRPTKEGFDIYLTMKFKLLYKGAVMVKGNIVSVIQKAIHRTKRELISA